MRWVLWVVFWFLMGARAVDAQVGRMPECHWVQQCIWVVDANGARHLECTRVPVCP